MNSIKDITNDPDFIELVGKNLAEIRRIRKNKPEPKPGFRYKRDWFDRMVEADMFNAKFFIANIHDIWDKKSSLSGEFRVIIESVCDISLYQAFELSSKVTETVTD